MNRFLSVCVSVSSSYSCNSSSPVSITYFMLYNVMLDSATFVLIIMCLTSFSFWSPIILVSFSLFFAYIRIHLFSTAPPVCWRDVLPRFLVLDFVFNLDFVVMLCLSSCNLSLRRWTLSFMFFIPFFIFLTELLFLV